MEMDRSYLQTIEQSHLEDEWRALLSGRSREQLAFRPAPGEWSILEVVHHIGELEDLRLRRIHNMLSEADPLLEARGELSAVPSGSVDAMLDRWHATREALLQLGRSLDSDQLDRPGRHPQFGPTSPRDQFGKSEPHARNHFEQCRANLAAFEQASAPA